MSNSEPTQSEKPSIAQKLQDVAHIVWYGDSRAYIALLPLSWLFAGLASLRRFLYRRGVLKSYRMPVPVIVVGNITAGGSGKTPVTLWLAIWLKRVGKKPAIVSRGYGGQGSAVTESVTADSDPAIVGDEPVLLASRSGCPVYVDTNRVFAAQAAVAGGADIIICDDGLQHYRLQRDAEIAVIDGMRGIGNGHLLPAGPLRESEGRLDSVDRIMIQCEADESQPRYGNRAIDRRTTRFVLGGDRVRHLKTGSTRPLTEMKSHRVHAVAAIGNPERFFRYLEHYGLYVQRHPLADHAAISADDLQFDDDLPVIITEKDEVKCRRIASDKVWSLPVSLHLLGDESTRWLNALNTRLTDLAAAKTL